MIDPWVLHESVNEGSLQSPHIDHTRQETSWCAEARTIATAGGSERKNEVKNDDWVVKHRFWGVSK